MSGQLNLFSKELSIDELFEVLRLAITGVVVAEFYTSKMDADPLYKGAPLSSNSIQFKYANAVYQDVKSVAINKTDFNTVSEFEKIVRETLKDIK